MTSRTTDNHQQDLLRRTFEAGFMAGLGRAPADGTYRIMVAHADQWLEALKKEESDGSSKNLSTEIGERL